MDIIQRIAKERLASVEHRITAVQRGLSQLASRWKTRLVEALADPARTSLAATSVQEITALQTEVHGQLVSVGYEYWARRFVNSLTESQQLALDGAAALELPHPVHLSDVDWEGLSRLQNVAFAWLNNLGSEASAAITRGVITSAIAGIRKADLIENIKQAVDVKLVNYACTYADTALATYDREAHNQVYEAAGVKKYIYVGPLDIKTRPFCRKLIAHGPYTRAEIAKLDNGTKLKNAWTHGAGWNCRHIWMPAPQDLSKGET